MSPKLALASCLVSVPILALCQIASPPKPKVTITREVVKLDATHNLWIFRPKDLKGKHPLVLVAPAGSPLFYGNTLVPGDYPELVPYAKPGYIVVGYDVSGPEADPDHPTLPPVRAFMESEAGIKDGERALTYALRNIPEVDPSHVIAAGHSSAGTLALEFAASDSRVKACVAYAPVVEVSERISKLLPVIESPLPGFTAMIQRTSPNAHPDRIHCPLFLFHADDDDNVLAGPVRQFAAAVHQAKLIQVPSGGHYDSMVKQGIPAALDWLKSIGFAPKK